MNNLPMITRVIYPGLVMQLTAKIIKTKKEYKKITMFIYLSNAILYNA